jgi:hypothetical protein
MVHWGIEDFIKRHLRFKQPWNRKLVSSKDAVWQTLAVDIWLDGCEYAKDSQFKVFETTNFGWIVFGPETKTPDGNTPNKRIIKW